MNNKSCMCGLPVLLLGVVMVFVTWVCPVNGQTERAIPLEISALNLKLFGWQGGFLESHVTKDSVSVKGISNPSGVKRQGKLDDLVDEDPNIVDGGYIVPSPEVAGVRLTFQNEMKIRYIAVSPTHDQWNDGIKMRDALIRLKDINKTLVYRSTDDVPDIFFLPGKIEEASQYFRPAWYIFDLKRSYDAALIEVLDADLSIQEIEAFGDDPTNLRDFQALILHGHSGGYANGLISPQSGTILDDSATTVPGSDINLLVNGIPDIDSGFETGDSGFISYFFHQPKKVRYVAISPKSQEWDAIDNQFALFISTRLADGTASYHSYETPYNRFFVHGFPGEKPSYVIFDLGAEFDASVLEISGDNLSLQEIEAFSNLPDGSQFSRPGLAFYEYAYVPGADWPSIDTSIAINEGVVSTFNSDVHISPNSYFLKFIGRYWVAEASRYVFDFQPASNMRLKVNGLVLDPTPLPDGGSELAINLDIGMHSIELDFLEDGSMTAFSASYSINGGPVTPFTGDMLYLPIGHEGVSQPADKLPIKVGIVYSPATAIAYGDEFQYRQTYAASQLQSAVAGIPFDLIKPEDLLDYNSLTNRFGALLIPTLDGLTGAQAQTAADNLQKLMTEDGVGIVASSGLFSYDANGVYVPDQSWPLMEQIFRILPNRFGDGVPATVHIDSPAQGELAHPVLRAYKESGQIVSYDKLYFEEYVPAQNASVEVLARVNSLNEDYNAVVAGSRGVGKFVHFGSIDIMMDMRMVWASLRWVFSQDTAGSPFTLSPTRHDGIFLGRNDMDLSRFFYALNNTEIPLLEFLKDWKNKYNFVGSYYINNGDNPANGEFTDWSVSKPLYDQYIEIGNEIGTHSYTHPQQTSLLSAPELQFEFQQSKLEIEAGLGNTVYGTAIPGEDETLFVVDELKQYLDYISGHGFYSESDRVQNPSIGYLNPDDNLLYYSLNMTPDFVLGDVMNLTPEESIQFWKEELASASKGMPKGIVQFLWHDYAVTTAVASGKYSPAMIEETVKEAFLKNYEFVTLEDFMKRFQAARNNQLQYTWNDADTLTIQLNGAGLGQYAMEFSDSYNISSVKNWYAYDENTIFVPENGGIFEVNLATSMEPVSRISKLPMRLKLLTTSGDGKVLEFSGFGDGIVEVTLNAVDNDKYQVYGARKWEYVSNNLIRIHLEGIGNHNISVQPTANILPIVDDISVTSDWNMDVPFTITGQDFDGTIAGVDLLTQPANGTIVMTGLNGVYTPNPGFAGLESISISVIDDLGGVSLPGTLNILINATNIPDGLANFNYMNRTFVLDGMFDEWGGLETYVVDPIDANALNDQLDFRDISFAHNDTHFFISYKSELPAPLNWAHNIYIDIDSNIGTGYQYWHVGGDILIQGGTLYQYQGSGTDWNWQSLPASQIATALDNTQFEIAIDKSVFGASQYFKMVFLADNYAYSGSTFDFAPDGFTTLAETFEYYFVDPNGNFPPSATPDSTVILKDTSAAFVLTGTDRESSVLTFDITTQPLNGSLTGTAPDVTYTPNPGYTGNDSFEFTVSDGELVSAPAMVNISVIDFPANGLYTNDGSSVFLDGNLSEWQSMLPLPSDPVETSGQTSGIDWKNAYLAHDSSSLFIAIENVHSVMLNWGLMVFIDSDQNPATGYNLTPVPGHGFDVMIQGASIFQYGGTGLDWTWTFSSYADRGIEGNVMEFRIPLLDLGISTLPAQANIVFHGDNAAFQAGGILDLYPDSASAFGPVWQYQFTNLVPESQSREDQPIEISEGYNHTLSILAGTPKAFPGLSKLSSNEGDSSNHELFQLRLNASPRTKWNLEKSLNLKEWNVIYEWTVYGSESQIVLPDSSFSDEDLHFFLRGKLVPDDGNSKSAF